MGRSASGGNRMTDGRAAVASIALLVMGSYVVGAVAASAHAATPASSAAPAQSGAATAAPSTDAVSSKGGRAPEVGDALIRELGLVVSSTPSRELPGWRKPKRVYLRASDADRLPAFRAVAPGVEFVLVGPGAKALPPADVAINLCSPAVFAASPDLRWIQLLSHGIDGCLRVPAVIERKPVLTAGKGGVTAPVADHAMALVLAHARGLDYYGAQQRERRWVEDTTAAEAAGELQPERELRGSTMLIYGLGGIGTEIAKRAHAFDMRITGIRASGRTGPDYVAYVGLPDELYKLAAEADYVVNVAPLTDATRKVFDDRFFAALKPGAFFVSVGRGPSTDLDALMRALKSGRLGGAGLDVTDPEPLPADHPLWTMRKVIITPHSAGATVGGFDRRWQIAVENLRRWVAGEPLIGVVDLSKGY
jgi:phosphoglycerate dehydrogenase-like enzyme